MKENYLENQKLFYDALKHNKKKAARLKNIKDKKKNVLTTEKIVHR